MSRANRLVVHGGGALGLGGRLDGSSGGSGARRAEVLKLERRDGLCRLVLRPPLPGDHAQHDKLRRNALEREYQLQPGLLPSARPRAGL